VKSKDLAFCLLQVAYHLVACLGRHLPQALEGGGVPGLLRLAGGGLGRRILMSLLMVLAAGGGLGGCGCQAVQGPPHAWEW